MVIQCDLQVNMCVHNEYIPQYFCLWLLSILSSLVNGNLSPHGHSHDCIAECLFVAGRCITAMFRKFHPEHFVCAFCLKQLNKGTFKEQNDKPYCHGCFEKLFG
jgi:hypothetical protein